MQSSSLTYVLHNLNGQFSPFQFFIFLLKIFKEFAILYSGGRFAQKKVLWLIVSKP